MNNLQDGFYAGVNAFSLISSHLGVNPEEIKEIEYNGFIIKLCEINDPSTIFGVGEPYATIAKHMNEVFNKAP